jgi:hypothetical protein
MQFNIVRWRNGRRINVDFDAGWKHPLGKDSDLVGLVGKCLTIPEAMISINLCRQAAHSKNYPLGQNPPACQQTLVHENPR